MEMITVAISRDSGGQGLSRRKCSVKWQLLLLRTLVEGAQTKEKWKAGREARREALPPALSGDNARTEVVAREVIVGHPGAGSIFRYFWNKPAL